MLSTPHFRLREVLFLKCDVRYVVIPKPCTVSLSETNGQIITVPAELHTSIDLPCICPICPESIFAVQWYKSSRSDVYVQDGKALAWWYEGETGSSQGFGIKDDFSMMIYNLTDKHDQELYRCIISLVSGAAECTHDVKLGIYGKYLFVFIVISFHIEVCF